MKIGQPCGFDGCHSGVMRQPKGRASVLGAVEGSGSDRGFGRFRP